MANEITTKITMKLANGVDAYLSDRGQIQSTQTTTRPANLMGAGSINVSTDAAVTIPGVAAGNYGMVVLENLDTTAANYIDFGPDNAGAIKPCVRIYAGRQACFQLIPSVTYRAVASAGTQVLQITAFAV